MMNVEEMERKAQPIGTYDPGVQAIDTPEYAVVSFEFICSRAFLFTENRLTVGHYPHSAEYQIMGITQQGDGLVLRRISGSLAAGDK